MNKSTRTSNRNKQKRERSREKEEITREEKDENESAITQTTTITLTSQIKSLLEQFVDNEVKKKFNKDQYELAFKKQKNKFTYTFGVKEAKVVEEMVKIIKASEIFVNQEMQVFLDDKELEMDVVEETKEKNSTNNIENLESDQVNFLNVREILVTNIPDKLTHDKLYDIFFIYGDINKIEFIKGEKKAFITYKYCSSAEKAINKMNSEKHQSKNFTVSLSDPNKRSNIQGDEEESKKEGRVVFLKFSDPEKVPDKEEVKRQLKKFGMVSKIFRKKEGKSYYLEFADASSAYELIRDFHAGVFKPSSFRTLVEIEYAFLKDQLKEKNQDEKINVNQTEEENFYQTREVNVTQEKSDQPIQKFDPNKHWQVYFDQTFQRNFYFNPFFNQSVWELQEGAELTPHQSNEYYYDPDQNNQRAIEQKEEIEIPQEKEQNYYDDEAWEEDELVEKLVWDKMKEQQLKEWMKRPARQQVADTRRDTAYVEGNYDYNIWYDKYLTDRKEEKEKIPALHRCNPALDTGYTKADLQERKGGAFFCMFFAKGCCSEGVNCRYYHRVPTKADAEKIENLRDVFGRSRFAAHRTDMGGVGSFTKECRSLYVSDLKMVDTVNPIKEMIRIIYENFSEWGEIEDINYIHTKASCFIKYSHRCSAEFAKEAMIGQSLVGEEVLTVKWAYDDPNPMNKKRTEKENENRFLSAYQTKKENVSQIKKKIGSNMPNVDYYNYYNNKNNPYAYSSGYGIEEDPNNPRYPVTDEVTQVTQNCIKLSETLKMIEENLDNQNEDA